MTEQQLTELDAKWIEVKAMLQDRFGKVPDMEAILFLIGMNEVGFNQDKEFKKEEQSNVAKEIKEKKSKTVERKAEESEKRKERPLTKEERLAGITIAYEDESVSKSFKKSDLYVYIVLIVLLVFVVMMLIFAYSLNPVV